jgi:hypothetical protein
MQQDGVIQCTILKRITKAKNHSSNMLDQGHELILTKKEIKNGILNTCKIKASFPDRGSEISSLQFRGHQRLEAFYTSNPVLDPREHFSFQF